MAVKFSSASDRLERLSSTCLDPTGDLTILGTAKYNTGPTDPSKYRTIYAIFNTPDYTDEYIWIGSNPYSGTILFKISDGSTTITIDSSFTPTLGTFFDWALVKSGSGWEAFINGSSVGTDTLSLAGKTFANEFIGGDGAAFSTTNASHVDICEFRSWEAALTSVQIIAEQDSALAIVQTGLFIDSPFDAADSDGMRDFSGNGRNWTSQTISGFATHCSVTSPVPANDLPANAITISSLPYHKATDVTNATSEGLALPCVGPAGDTSFDIWFKWTAPSSADVIFDIYSYADAQLEIYTGTPGSLTPVQCEPDNGSYSFTPTNGTTYYILLAGWSGSFSEPIVTDFVLRSAGGTTAPVLTVSSVSSSRNLGLSWTASSPTPDSYQIERCSGSGCSGFSIIVTINGGLTAYTDRSLTASTLYRYRIKAISALNGDSDYSNTDEGTTDAGNAGVVQYGFAIGAVGGFGKTNSFFTSSSQGKLGILGIMGSANNDTPIVSVGIVDTGAGGGYDTFPIRIVYYENGVENIVDTDPMVQVSGSGPPNPFAYYKDVNSKLEMRGRLGSADTLTGTHAADGYIEIRWNETVVWSLTDIALGRANVAGWAGTTVKPAGAKSTVLGGYNVGDWTDQNGGMKTLYISDIDEYGPGVSPKYYYDDFNNYTDADLFKSANPSNPWQQYSDNSNSNVDDPPIIQGYSGQPNRLCEEDDTVTSATASHMYLVSPITPQNLLGETTTATLIIQKVTIPTTSHTEFTVRVSGGPSPATLTLGDGDSQTYTDAEGGPYSVTEDAIDGWTPSIVVDNGDSPSAITVPANTTVIVTITNTFTGNPADIEGSGHGTTTGSSTGSLRIVKSTVPSGGVDFVFITNLGGYTSVTLDDGEQIEITGITPGDGYSVSETPKINWTEELTVSNSSSLDNIVVLAGTTTIVTAINTFVATTTGGIYFISPGKRNDTIYSLIGSTTTTTSGSVVTLVPPSVETIAVKIPDPYIEW